MASPLFDASFVRELEALRRRLVARARSGGAGDLLARRRGGSAEFLEHRPYAAGDDLRRVDWLAFARSGEPVTKTFRTEEDVAVRLLVDASRSLDVGAPTKLHVAQRLAASVGYLALAGASRAQVLVAGEGLTRTFEPTRGRGAFPALLRTLEAVPNDARGGTDLTKAIAQVVARAPRPGMLVVVSDFFDPGPFDRALERAAAAGHDLVLAQVLAPEELSPDEAGDVALEDDETGAVVELTLDARAIAAYHARLASLFAALRALAKRLRATYVRTSTVDAPLDAVRRIVTRAVD